MTAIVQRVPAVATRRLASPLPHAATSSRAIVRSTCVRNLETPLPYRTRAVVRTIASRAANGRGQG